MSLANAPRSTLAASSALPPEDEVRAAAEYARTHGRSEETRRLYSREWASYLSWCTERGATALPSAPETVATYLHHLAQKGRRPAGIDAALAAISQAHHAGGHDGAALRASAPVRQQRGAIRRDKGTAQKRASPLTADLVVLAIEHDRGGLAAIRDRAVLLVGHALLPRGGELHALQASDVVFRPRGAEITIRRGKTDQEGAGVVLAIERERVRDVCPVAALEAWLAASGITEGPLFRAVDRWGHLRGELSRKDVSRVVKRYAVAIGLDPRDFSSHSIRAGGATSAALAGKSEGAIMRRGRWSSPAMAQRYVRIADRWADNPTAGLLSRAALDRGAR